MTRNRSVVLTGAIMFVLVSAAQALATPITAQLTMRAVGDFPAPPRFEANMSAIVTLEPDPGPFWWPNLQQFLPASNGFVITSLVGTFNGNPAAIILDDPLRPPWMVQISPSFSFLQLGYLRFQSGGGVWQVNSDTATVTDIIISGPPGFTHVIATATPVPELPSVALTAGGLVALLCLALRDAHLRDDVTVV